MVRLHLQSHFMALHPGLTLFLRRYAYNDWLDHVVKWVWDSFARVSRAFYRDIKNIETDFGAAVEEID